MDTAIIPPTPSLNTETVVVLGATDSSSSDSPSPPPTSTSSSSSSSSMPVQPQQTITTTTSTTNAPSVSVVASTPSQNINLPIASLPPPPPQPPIVPPVNLAGETPERVYELLQVVWRYQRATAAEDDYAKTGWKSNAIDWYKVSRYLARVRLEKRVGIHSPSKMDNLPTKQVFDTKVWPAAHCRKVWKSAAYGSSNGGNSKTSTSSSSSSSSSSSADAPVQLQDDPGSDNESMSATICPLDTFVSKGWKDSIEERERSILEESFVLSGGALYRTKLIGNQQCKLD